MMSKIQLVNFVIIGSLNYSFQIYKWLASPIKDVDSCIINFIYIGANCVLVNMKVACKL